MTGQIQRPSVVRLHETIVSSLVQLHALVLCLTYCIVYQSNAVPPCSTSLMGNSPRPDAKHHWLQMQLQTLPTCPLVEGFQHVLQCNGRTVDFQASIHQNLTSLWLGVKWISGVTGGSQVQILPVLSGSANTQKSPL